MSRTYPTALYVVQTWPDAHGQRADLRLVAECAEDALEEAVSRGYKASIHDVYLAGCVEQPELIPTMTFLLQRVQDELKNDPASSRRLKSEISNLLLHIKPTAVKGAG